MTKIFTVKIDIHFGVIKIAEKTAYYDYFQLNHTEFVIVGTDIEQVLAMIQRGFDYQFRQHKKEYFVCVC